LKTVRLPDKVSDADLLAIARVHFPRLSADHLEYVVSLVSITERNYVSDVAKIARLANQYAIDAGRPEITLAEIDAAVADVLPAIPPSAAPLHTPPPAPISRRARAARQNEPATAPHETGESELFTAPARAMQPVCNPISRSNPDTERGRRSGDLPKVVTTA
jgi:hypothetical protein